MNEQTKTGDTELQKIKRDVLTRTIGGVLAAMVVGLAVGIGGAVYAFSSGLIKATAREVLINDPAERTNLIDEILERASGDTRLRDALGVVPAGAVVAFDHADGCPPSWTEFTAGAGRFIIGVGYGYRLVYERGEAQYQTGGEETHALTIEEMPPHQHVTSLLGATRHGRLTLGNAGERIAGIAGSNYSSMEGTYTSFEGGADDGSVKPHNNMPPYIALYFCRKEAP